MHVKKSLLGLSVFFLTLTGCASSPTHFASPDADNFRYTVDDGERIKTTKPEPRSMGFNEWSPEGRTGEVFDFTRVGWSENPYVSDEHMVAVTAFDPDIKGGRLVIPIQYVDRIEPNYENSLVFHTIDGIASPLKIDVSLDDRQGNDTVLREYSSKGKFVDVIHHVRTNNNPMIDYATIHEGNLVENFVVSYRKGTIYEFPKGEAFETAWEKTTEHHKKMLKESAEIRAELDRKTRAKQRQIQQALAADKPVGQMVCSLDKWMGVVEQVEGDRLKVRIIGKASVSGDMLLSKTYPIRFDIDTSDEGKLRWMDNDNVGVCDIDVEH